MKIITLWGCDFSAKMKRIEGTSETALQQNPTFTILQFHSSTITLGRQLCTDLVMAWAFFPQVRVKYLIRIKLTNKACIAGTSCQLLPLLEEQTPSHLYLLLATVKQTTFVVSMTIRIHSQVCTLKILVTNSKSTICSSKTCEGCKN